MYLKNRLGPPGVQSLRKDGRMPVVKVVSGDSCRISTSLSAADGGPASPKNCTVEFVLSENQFSPPLWTGRWASGVTPDENRPGLVHVDIPRDLTRSLRRGSYMFSIRVGDMMNWEFRTQSFGYLLVEYAPTSDQRSIPYRDGTSELHNGSGQGSSGSSGSSGSGSGSGSGIVIDPTLTVKNAAADAQAVGDALKEKQDKLSQEQLANIAAVPSKQDQLSEGQLAAVNSGVTAAKLSSMESAIGNARQAAGAAQQTADAAVTAANAAQQTADGKQSALDADQLAAVNSGVTADRLLSIESGIDGAQGTADSALSKANTLVGDDAGLSAREIAADEVTKVVDGAPAAFDTLKELADWIGDDQSGAAKAIADIESSLALKAPLASPALTGTPTAPTAEQGTNTTQIATTAFVKAAVDAVDVSSQIADKKDKQTAVSSPTASGDATSFIDTISQNENGVITPTKKNIPAATDQAAGLMSASDKGKLDGIASGAQVNVQSDWNAASGDAAILNKPALAAVATSGAYSDLSGTPSLAAVATSGAYSDLSGTPSLAAVATSGAYSDLSGTPNLATVATSGSYNDLENKPTIPEAQVQSDWNEDDSSSKAFIQNKPTIPAAQVQSDWNEDDSSSKAFIQNKPSIPSVDGLAPLASPALTGVPTAPTAVQGTDTTQIATTEFVNDAVAAVDVSSQISGKLNSAAAATPFDPTAGYLAGEYVTYEGAVYRFTANHMAGAWTGSDAEVISLTSPDASLDLTSAGALRVVKANGDLLWQQGYDLKIDSSASPANEAVNAYAFAQDATDVVTLTLPAVDLGKVGDFVLDVSNPALGSDFLADATYAVGDRVVYSGAVWTCTAAHTGAWAAADFGSTATYAAYDSASTAGYAVGALVVHDGKLWKCTTEIASGSAAGTFNEAYWSTASFAIAGLPTTLRVIVPAGENLTEMVTIGPGVTCELYFTLTAFQLNSLPTWKIVRQDVEVA